MCRKLFFEWLPITLKITFKVINKMICLFHLQNWFYFQTKSFVSIKLKIAQIIFLITNLTGISYNNVLAGVHYYLVSVLSTLAYKQVSNKVWWCHTMFKTNKKFASCLLFTLPIVIGQAPHISNFNLSLNYL